MAFQFACVFCECFIMSTISTWSSSVLNLSLLFNSITMLASIYCDVYCHFVLQIQSSRIYSQSYSQPLGSTWPISEAAIFIKTFLKVGMGRFGWWIWPLTQLEVLWSSRGTCTASKQWKRRVTVQLLAILECHHLSCLLFTAVMSY